MRTQFKKILFVLVIIGGFSFIWSLYWSATRKQAFLTDKSSVRNEVEVKLKEIQQMRPTVMSTPDFRSHVIQLLQESPVSTIWLFDQHGNLIEAKGGTSRYGRGKPIDQFVSIDVKGVLDTIPDEVLTREQRQMIRVASYIRAEWVHNDTCRHLVVPINDSKGQLVGVLGVNYSVPVDFTIAKLSFLILARFLGFMLFWFGLPLWVYMDCKGKRKNAFLWAMFVLVGNIAALLAYLITRDPVSIKK